ncbi:MAG: hypothetical protein ACFNTM_00220 [Cardiobacterium sp.]
MKNKNMEPRNAALGANEFIAAGRLLWGEHWQRSMQEALQINQIARIRAWASGASRIPTGVWRELEKLLGDRGNTINELRRKIANPDDI